jgi:endoglucanase
LDTKEFLRRLCQGVGVSGYEHGLVDTVREAMSPYVARVTVDAMGNCWAVRTGQAPEPRVKIMLAAHMDEIGLMVSKYEDGGFLRVVEVGGFDPRALVGQEVVVHTAAGDLPGIIGIKPPHIMTDEDRKKSPPLHELFVDVGLDDAAARTAVAVGDVITLKRDFVELAGEVVAGKALDDRAGVAVMLECLKRLAQLHHSADVYAVATVQEEVGLKGAATGAHAINPDLGVAIDVGHAGPGLPEHESINIGGGPAIAIGANIHPKLHALLVATAKECGIAYQDDVAPGQTGTDAWSMQISREGIPTALLSLPLRYMHTSVETGSMADIRAAGRLLAEFCARVDRALVEGLRWD